MLDSRQFRQVMGSFATGVAVATTYAADGTSVGLTINSLTSVSLDPPLVLFCLDGRAHLCPVFRKAEHFSVHFLTEEQEDVSRYFADQHHNPKPKNMWGKPQGDCPILRHTLGWIVCRKVADHKGGDHRILVGEVTQMHRAPNRRDPLLYFHGRYRKIKITSPPKS